MVQIRARAGGFKAAQTFWPYMFPVPSGGTAGKGAMFGSVAGIQQNNSAVAVLAISPVSFVFAIIVTGTFFVRTGHQRPQGLQQTAAA